MIVFLILKSIHESMESNAAMNDAEMDVATENPLLFKSELEIATPSLSPCEARHSPNSTIINQDFLDDHEDEQLDSLFLPSEVQGELSYSISYNGQVIHIWPHKIGTTFEVIFVSN
jgi:hypothetical protein